MLLAWWIQTCVTNSKGKRHLVWGATHPLPLLLLIFPPYLEEGFLFFFWFFDSKGCSVYKMTAKYFVSLAFVSSNVMDFIGVVQLELHSEFTKNRLYLFMWLLCSYESSVCYWKSLVASLFKCRFLFSVIISVFCHILFKFHFTIVLQDTLSARNKGKHFFSLIWGNHCTAAGSKHWKKHTVFK